MLQDFLRQCSCTRPDEVSDFRDVCNTLETQVPAVAYMPSITWDLWPIYALRCTDARRCLGAKVPRVYLVPIGAHEGWAMGHFAKLVLKFYREDTCPDVHCYGYKVEEMILLNYPESGSHLELEEYGICSAVYLHLSRNTGEDVHVFLLMEDPSEGWNRIIRKYEIPVHVLIDSHKGLGDWFQIIPLRRYMEETQRALLPEFYFKGKFTPGVPLEWVHLWDIPEIERNTRVSQLYRMNWENM